MNLTQREIAVNFRTAEVRSILKGGKTQFCRPLKAHLTEDLSWIRSWYVDGGGNWIGWSCDVPGLASFTKEAYPSGEGMPCPFGKVGDLLWVRETWYSPANQKSSAHYVRYQADSEIDTHERWRSPVIMPKWASRITLKTTNIDIKRLQSLKPRHVRAEGFADMSGFRDYWNCYYKQPEYVWDADPWLWLVSFDLKKVQKK